MLISDLHLRDNPIIHGKILASLRAYQPDYIFIAGDTIDNDEQIPVVRDFFKQFPETRGIYAVLGNWEHWSHSDSENVFSSLGVKLLVNQSARLSNNITLYGFDDQLAGAPARDLTSSMGALPDDFCISLFHSPVFFEQHKPLCPLSFSGHTHGGQVRLPFFSPFWLPEGSGKYVSGWYESDDGKKMYVSRGVGNSILPIRFFARPEITEITIRRVPR